MANKNAGDNPITSDSTDLHATIASLLIEIPEAGRSMAARNLIDQNNITEINKETLKLVDQKNTAIREGACLEEIQAVLDKYNCKLEVSAKILVNTK